MNDVFRPGEVALFVGSSEYKFARAGTEVTVIGPYRGEVVSNSHGLKFIHDGFEVRFPCDPAIRVVERTWLRKRKPPPLGSWDDVQAITKGWHPKQTVRVA